MVLLEKGRVCIKKYGRDAGSKAVVTVVEDNGFVRILSAGRKKERRVNSRHLEFLAETVDVSDKETIKQRVDDLMEVTLDDRNKSDKERIAAAVQAFTMIRKHGLLDASIVDKILDEDATELIESGEKLFRGAKRLLDRIQGKKGDEPATSSSGTRRRRRRS